MTIGNHLLHGKIVKLEKPFAVLEKQVGPLSTSDSPTNLETKYIIKGTITHKILFSSRPRVIQI